MVVAGPGGAKKTLRVFFIQYSEFGILYSEYRIPNTEFITGFRIPILVPPAATRHSLNFLKIIAAKGTESCADAGDAAGVDSAADAADVFNFVEIVAAERA